MISFIRSLSPVAAPNLPAKKRAGLISQIFFFARTLLCGLLSGFTGPEGHRDMKKRQID
jgi:hypothetical protein